MKKLTATRGSPTSMQVVNGQIAKAHQLIGIGGGVGHGARTTGS